MLLKPAISLGQEYQEISTSVSVAITAPSYDLKKKSASASPVKKSE